ncbi:signal peptidase I SipW [Sutcliffiella deserti]|uniref:signal peptidase I SipW n=1 Tax=Sutcliffiella deserti TaxID=2875501 RepID=UPI001CBEEBC2|nr:signal peptidase I [Sutcliffiella deserti]
MKSKKLLKIMSNVISTVLFLTLIFMVFVVISSKASGGEPHVFGYQLKTVLSGSMEPEFNTGSIISIKPVEDAVSLKENDVITYMQADGSVVTHRIIEVVNNGEQTMYQTKGDNNADLDGQLVLPQNVVGIYTGFTIPFLGYFIEFAKSSKGTATLLIVPGLLLLVYSTFSITSAIKDLDKLSKKATKEEELNKPA